MFFIYTITVGINSFFRYNRFRQEYVLKMNSKIDLKERQSKINKMLNGLKENRSWEMLSREKLNMIKENESVYRFYYEGKNVR